MDLNDQSYSNNSCEVESGNVEEDEKMKAIIQTLIDFNDDIEDMSILGKILKSISIHCNESTEFILNHPLFSETELIDHFISLISDEELPPSIKILAVDSISPFLRFFDEDQVITYLEQPFFNEIFELFLLFVGKSDESQIDGLWLAKILRFLSNICLSSNQARDEVIKQLPIDNECESIESKTIEIFSRIECIVKSGDIRTQTKEFLHFFKSLCFYPLEGKVYESACEISLNLIKTLPKEHYESLIKLNWYICKNGFVDIVASKPAFFDIFLNLSFFKRTTIKTIKCFSKIIKSMNEYNLSKCFDFKLFVECVTELDLERSIIILDLIDHLTTETGDDLKDIYLNCFLENQLLFQLKKVISSEKFTVDHKCESLRILKTIVFKNIQILILHIVNKKFIQPMLELLALKNLPICESVTAILHFIINSCISNNSIHTIVSQIKTNNGYQSILTLIDDIENTGQDELLESPLFECTLSNSKEIIDMINSVEVDKKPKETVLPLGLNEGKEEEEKNENEPEWSIVLDSMMTSILSEKAPNIEEEEEEWFEHEHLPDVFKSILITIPVEDEIENGNENDSKLNKEKEEEIRREREIGLIKSKEIFASILEDYEKRDHEREEEEDFGL